MASRRCGFRGSPARLNVHLKLFLTVAFVLLLVAGALAQQSPVANTPPSQMQSTDVDPGQAPAPVTLPAGTHVPLVLTHPIDSKTMHRGDQINAQVTAPVVLDGRVVIPAGTFMQGRIDKLTRRNTRGEFVMQSLSLVFPDGYVAGVQGATTIESGEGTAIINPSGGRAVGAIAAPLAGAGLGALIGSAAHTKQSTTLGGTTLTSNTPKGTAIGSLVGGATGAVVSIVLLTRSRDFYVDVGSPMEITLAQPLTLAQAHVAAPAAQIQVLTPTVRRPDPVVATDHGTCYTPGTPGTPPTVIRGTPTIGDSPGTPDTVIPGTPPTPGMAYPCP